jgi:hypothetical protein
VVFSQLVLIRLFQRNSICWDRVLVERPGKVCAAPYLLIRGRLAPGPETKQGLERGHGLPAPIVAKDEFIKINLKLIATHAVIGSDQPLLEIPKTLYFKKPILEKLSLLLVEAVRFSCDEHLFNPSSR